MHPIPLLDKRSGKERFWSRVAVRGEDECWPWQGPPTYGYGQLYFGGRPHRSHRIAYLLVKGLTLAELDGQHVHHECENRLCCNPRHLRALPASEHSSLHNPAPEACPLCGGEMVRAPRGTWVCRPCDRDRNAAKRAARTPQQLERDRAKDRERKRLARILRGQVAH